jgi:hypothetical protein
LVERSTTTAKWVQVFAVRSADAGTSTWSLPIALASTEACSCKLLGDVPMSCNAISGKSPDRPMRNTLDPVADVPSVYTQPSIVKLLVPKKLM